MADKSVALSALFANPVLRDAFRRAERDNGAAFAIPAPKAPVLSGGQAKQLEVA